MLKRLDWKSQYRVSLSRKTGPHRVFRNAIKAALSLEERLSPNLCPLTARTSTPEPLKPVGT